MAGAVAGGRVEDGPVRLAGGDGGGHLVVDVQDEAFRAVLAVLPDEASYVISPKREVPDHVRPLVRFARSSDQDELVDDRSTRNALRDFDDA